MLEHAQHYVGMTNKLSERLSTHRSGQGANILKIAKERGINWHLAGLWQTTAANARRVERELKAQNNTPQFCPSCTTHPRQVPAGIPYPIPKDLPNRTTNQTEPLRIRNATDFDFDFILATMQSERHCLGYIPHEGITAAIDMSRALVANFKNKRAGYIIFTETHDLTTIKIQQTVVVDEYRLRGVGRAMLDTLEAQNPNSVITCKVRDDLPANLFWEASGYHKIRTLQHETSLSTLNQYLKDVRTCTK